MARAANLQLPSDSIIQLPDFSLTRQGGPHQLLSLAPRADELQAAGHAFSGQTARN